MNNFDFSLRPIKDMLPFDNLFDSDSDYMKELSSLPKIKLDAEALYTLDVTPRIIFTPKLRYYRRLLEKEVNRHLNRAHKLMEGEGHEDLSRYIIKQTREAVITLAKEYNSYLVQVDGTGDYWKSLTSDNPDYIYTPVCEPPCFDHLCSGSITPPKELVVFYHNAIAELARCLLELQDRYAYLIGTDGLYDVSLFYSSITGCSQDRTFCLKQTDKYETESKKFKKHRPDCSFIYDNKEYFGIAIQEFTNKLKKHKLIEDTVDYKQVESLFSGHPCRTTIKWLGDNHLLTWIIKGLCGDDDPVVKTWPEGYSSWTIVSCRFLNKEGKPMPNIRTESERKTTRDVVEEVVNALAAYT